MSRKQTSEIDFSYGQFNVYDKGVRLPGCRWTKRHYSQGFARRPRNAAFRTLLEYGLADVPLSLAHLPKTYRKTYQRVISVPIETPSGLLVVAGPEDLEEAQRFEVPQVVLPGGRTKTDISCTRGYRSLSPCPGGTNDPQ